MKFSTSLKNVWGSVVRRFAHIKRDSKPEDAPITLTLPELLDSFAPSTGVTLPIAYVVYDAEHSVDAFDLLPSSPSYHFTISGESISPTSSYSSSYSTPSLPSSDSTLGLANNDGFVFDVWMTPKGDENPVLVPCPTVIPWSQLVAILAAEAQRPEKDVVFFNKEYIGLISDEEDYEAWLEWSRMQEGSSDSDLWLL